MSARRERGKRSALQRVLLDDIWRKLASLGLAILLWYFLNSQIELDRPYHGVLLTWKTNQQDDVPGPKQLQLQLSDPDRMVERFERADDRTPIKTVNLELQGPRHLMEQFLEADPGLTVTPGTAQLRESFEFTLENIRVRDERYQRLLQSMEPSMVKAVLIPRKTEVLTLDATRVRIDPPESIPDFDQRARIADWTVTPNAPIKLSGPATDLERFIDDALLFRLDIRPTGLAPNQVQGTLALLDTARNIVMSPPHVVVTIPLRPVFEQYDLEVGIGFDDDWLPEPLRGRFELTRNTSTVRLQVTGIFASELRDKTEDELRAWVERQAILVPQLPEEPTNGALIPLKLVLFPKYQEREHYRIISITPTVSLTEKNEENGESGNREGR